MHKGSLSETRWGGLLRHERKRYKPKQKQTESKSKEGKLGKKKQEMEKKNGAADQHRWEEAALKGGGSE